LLSSFDSCFFLFLALLPMSLFLPVEVRSCCALLVVTDIGRQPMSR
jgi:hypothetical protein